MPERHIRSKVGRIRNRNEAAERAASEAVARATPKDYRVGERLTPEPGTGFQGTPPPAGSKGGIAEQIAREANKQQPPQFGAPAPAPGRAPGRAPAPAAPPSANKGVINAPPGTNPFASKAKNLGFNDYGGGENG